MTDFPLDLATASKTAQAAVRSLREVERWEVAGELRRGLSAGDMSRRVQTIELVIAPRHTERRGQIAWSPVFWASLREDPRWTIAGSPTNGALEVWMRSRKQPRLLFVLHLTRAAHFGNRLLLATGPAGFLGRLTELHASGSMRACAGIPHLVKDGRPVETPTEEAAFEALGLRPAPPHKRADSVIDQLRVREGVAA